MFDTVIKAEIKELLSNKSLYLPNELDAPLVKTSAKGVCRVKPRHTANIISEPFTL